MQFVIHYQTEDRNPPPTGSDSWTLCAQSLRRLWDNEDFKCSVHVVVGGLGGGLVVAKEGICCWLSSRRWECMSLQDVHVLIIARSLQDAPITTRMNQLVTFIHPRCQLASTRIAAFHVVVPTPSNSWPDLYFEMSTCTSSLYWKMSCPENSTSQLEESLRQWWWLYDFHNNPLS